MGALAEHPATAVARTDNLADGGLALAMWEAARQRDQHSGTLVMAASPTRDLISSAGSVLVALLRRAGHHHRDAHDEVRDGSLPEHAEPFTEPWLNGVTCCGPIDEPVCGCDVETACRLLADIVAGTPGAVPLTQIAAQFSEQRDRTTFTLTGVNVVQVIVLIEAACLLVVHRWRTDATDVFNQTRRQVLTDQAHL